MRYFLVVVFLHIATTSPARAEAAATGKRSARIDITEVMLQSTVRIEATGSSGTGFLVEGPHSLPILVTAGHVLQSINEPEVKLVVRRRKPKGFEYARISFKLTEFVKLDKVDVAALPVQLPPEVLPEAMITSDLLADDTLMQRHGVSPGQQVFLVSYPLGLLGTEEGFGMLKSASVATYPLYPTRQRQIFGLDREIVEGEYGAPVFVRVEAGPSKGFGFVIGILGKPWESGTTKMRPMTVVPSGLVKDIVEKVTKALKEAAPKPLRG